MVTYNIIFSKSFKDTVSKIKDITLKTKISKQIKKIIDNPEVGKPMRNVRKGTREVYIKPHRLSYSFIKKEKEIIFLALYHKNEQ